MNFQLCQNFVSVDKLVECFTGTSNLENDMDVRKSLNFSLVIDKRISSYPYSLVSEDARISLVDLNIKYLNTPNLNTSLPAIFTTRKIKGRFLVDVIHPTVSSFYKNLMVSTFQERSVVRLHIILNNVHILLTTYPFFDNKNKVKGCTLVEIPFSNIASVDEVANSADHVSSNYKA